jgi:hypothetical protein
MTRDEKNAVSRRFEDIFDLARNPQETNVQGDLSQIRRICREANMELNRMVSE